MINRIKNIANTEDKKRLLSNFFSLSVLQAFTYILPLLTLPYLVRVLGADKFGLVMFAQSFIMFFSILVDYGFNLSATREIAVHRDNKEKVTEIFSSVMQIKFILLGISFVILSIIVFSFEKFSTDLGLYYLTFLWVIGQALFPIWYFQGMERMKYITIVNIFSKLLFTILIFVFIQNESDYILVPILNGLGFISGGLISMWMIHKYFNQSFKIQNYQTIMIYFKDSSQFFLSRVSVSIYTSANAFVLGLFTNTTMVGYYSIAEKIYLAIQNLYAPITQTLYPYVAKAKNILLYKKVFYLSISINFIGIVLFYLGDRYFFNILFSAAIAEEVIPIFEIFLIAALIMVPSTLLGYSYLAALGYKKYANYSMVYASLFHLSGLLVLFLLGSVTAYTIATLVVFTQLVGISYRIYGIKKHNLWKKEK